jgi:hypothetical protein
MVRKLRKVPVIGATSTYKKSIENNSRGRTDRATQCLFYSILVYQISMQMNGNNCRLTK